MTVESVLNVIKFSEKFINVYFNYKSGANDSVVGAKCYKIGKKVH